MTSCRAPTETSDWALALAMQAFFAELDHYTLADLVASSPALATLPMWQPLTWQPPAPPRKLKA